MKKTLLVLLVFICIIPSVLAEISKFNIDFTISLGKAYVVENILLSERQGFNVELPEDASETSIFVDGSAYNIIGDSKEFAVKGRRINISYLTRKFIDKKNFVMEFNSPDKIDNLSINLNIPSNFELSRPVEEKTLASNVIFPKPSAITTDGQRMKITWERQDFRKDDSLSVLVMLKEKKDYSYLWYLLVAAVIVIFVLAIRIIKRKPQVKTIVKNKTAKIEEHLKEDEAQIVRLLKSRENQCEQGTLRVITGFSKAKLSGLLQELEDRKIVYKEKRGKKNIVFLK